MLSLRFNTYKKHPNDQIKQATDADNEIENENEKLELDYHISIPLD